VNWFLRELKGLEDVLANLAAYADVGPVTQQDEARFQPLYAPARDCKAILVELTASFKSCEAQKPESRWENFSKWLKMQFKGKSMEEAYVNFQSQKATLVAALTIATLYVQLRDMSMASLHLTDL